MKLSDIKGDRVLDVIADIIDPLSNIAQDEDARHLFKLGELPEGTAPWQAFVKNARRYAPSLIRSHKRDIVTILAAVNGVSYEEYERAMTVPRLMNDVVDLLADDGFSDFLGTSESRTPEG